MNTRIQIMMAVLFLATGFSLAGCDQNAVLPAPISDLDVELVSASIGANLMPIVAPDPISCRMTLTVHNRNASATFIGLAFREGTVVLDSTGAALGKIVFASTWDGRLFPGETDTVIVNKLTGAWAPFNPPCGARVTLRSAVMSLAGNSVAVTADSLLFQCVF